MYLMLVPNEQYRNQSELAMGRDPLGEKALTALACVPLVQKPSVWLGGSLTLFLKFHNSPKWYGTAEVIWTPFKELQDPIAGGLLYAFATFRRVEVDGHIPVDKYPNLVIDSMRAKWDYKVLADGRKLHQTFDELLTWVRQSHQPG
ncbi:MAG: hypothetical protein WDZ93_02115 [Candidatus Paceibacterota bacterium]